MRILVVGGAGYVEESIMPRLYREARTLVDRGESIGADLFETGFDR